MTDTVVYTAAHGGFAGQDVPLGGGAAICDLLVAEWSRTRPFRTQLVRPRIPAREIVRFGERQYAAFCRDFERQATEAVLRHDPRRVAVLVNDISEGPDFRRIAGHGYAVFTIWHVDVIAYVAAIYLHGRVSPQTLVRWHDRLGDRWMPDILKLIFRKQLDSAVYSRGVFVPSPAMKETLIACYPRVNPDKVHVVGWGAPSGWVNPAELSIARGELRRELGLPANAFVILTLSRISPEKGQDLLLAACLEWERRGTIPQRPVWLIICGEPAFMQGERFARKLRARAARLARIRVLFPGYVSGTRKQAFLRVASLYAFPSRHESYGLTLMEAFQAGLPALCLDHAGARAVMRPDFGEVVEGEPVAGLCAALERMSADPARLRDMGARARAWAESQPFSESAARIAAILLG